MKCEYCILCMENIYRKQTIYDYIKQDSVLCGECKSQLEVLNIKTKLDEITLHVVYQYNDFIENMIFQYKEGHDVALREVFFHDVIKNINDKFRHYTIVLMPSSNEKMEERGYLPVKEMLKDCKLNMIEPFYKSENRKQSLQSFENRAHINEVIKLKSDIRLPKTKLLLVDDVCTSGSTLKCAYHLLKKHTYKIEALALCAHPLFVENCDKLRLNKRGIFSIL
ncbi:MAG: phosphoribosyltransferase family protein [Longicatena sp.]